MFGFQPNLFSTILLLVVTVIAMISWIPQLIRLLKTKKSDDISTASYIIWIISYSLMVIYSIFFTTDIVLCIATIIEAAFCLIVMLLVIKFKTKKAKSRKG